MIASSQIFQMKFKIRALPGWRVLREAICLDCHNAEGPRKIVKTCTVHSTVCEY